ncbi:hypothetical protein Tco_0494895 [Tanacetum coccineum]
MPLSRGSTSVVQEEGKVVCQFSNYEFWLQEARFHRHVVNSNDIHVDSSKIEALKNQKKDSGSMSGFKEQDAAF